MKTSVARGIEADPPKMERRQRLRYQSSLIKAAQALGIADGRLATDQPRESTPRTKALTSKLKSSGRSRLERWPAPAIVSYWAPGMSWSSSFDSDGGVTLSSVPHKISVGTAIR